MSLIDVLLPVAALWLSLQTATVGPVPVTPEPKRIWGGPMYDGDSGQLRYEEGFSRIIFTVRLLEIDTPELAQAKCPQERAKGDQAKAAATEFLTRGPVFLTHVSPELEMYGRVLVKVGVRMPDGTIKDLAEHLKADPRGIARHYTTATGRQSWCEPIGKVTR